MTRLDEWLDQFHVNHVRTFATTLDSAGIGKYLSRRKFLKSVPGGHAISDIALAGDLGGTPHFTFWHDQRVNNFGDVSLKPDLTTLAADGRDPNLAHCICNFTDTAGEPLRLCPRSILGRMVERLRTMNYRMKVSIELEFFLFRESFDTAREKGYQELTPVTASHLPTIYMTRNSYRAQDFMQELIRRMDKMRIPWEGWNDEAGVGQFELNVEPSDPINAADNLMRSRQLLHEVAVDMDMSVTCMARPGRGLSNGMHIHHSLLQQQDDTPVFFDESATDHRSDTMKQWLAGLMQTLPASVSMLCPGINSYRRMVEFAAVPSSVTWGEENKTTALRTISRSPGLSRIEHRVGAGDLNPYLAIAVMIAGGIAGLENKLVPEGETEAFAWGLTDNIERLPNNISAAMKALQNDQYLGRILGEDVVTYWCNSRESEWLDFHGTHPEGTGRKVTPWELNRYFEII